MQRARLLHLAESLSLVDLVVLGDSLVRRGATTPQALVEAATAWSGVGAKRAREAAALVRPRVDSGPETRLRLLLVLAGLPEPEVDVHLRDAEGHLLHRLDLADRLHTSRGPVKLAVEYDGRHHERPSRRSPDLIRREDLEDDGRHVVVAVAEDVFDHPGRTLDRVVRAARRAGLPLPSRLGDRWRHHFPERG